MRWQNAIVAAALAFGVGCASAKAVPNTAPPPEPPGIGGAGTAGTPDEIEVPEGDPIDHSEPDEANKPDPTPAPAPEGPIGDG